MSIEAMKQALAKFESLWEIGIDAVYRVELLPEIQALRQAIEQAEKQQALDKKADNARELGLDYESEEFVRWSKEKEFFEAARTPLQAEKQEPVAYLCENAVGHKYFRWKKPTSHYKPIALYTAPPMTPEHLPQYIATDGKPMESGGGGVCSRPRKEWVGLTDEDIEKGYETTGHYQTLRPQDRFAVFALARAIEARLKEKNGG